VVPSQTKSNPVINISCQELWPLTMWWPWKRIKMVFALHRQMVKVCSGKTKYHRLVVIETAKCQTMEETTTKHPKGKTQRLWILKRISLAF
jgi:hypothetical protein